MTEGRRAILLRALLVAAVLAAPAAAPEAAPQAAPQAAASGQAPPRAERQTGDATPGARPAGETELRLEGAPFAAFRIDRARLVGSSGIAGLVRIAGRRWDGSGVELFAARVAARTEALDVAFYIDDELESLEVQVDSPEGTRRLDIDLPAAEPRGGSAAPGAPNDAALLRELDPPLRLDNGPPLPERLDIVDSSLSSAGGRVASSFARPAPRRAWLLLLLTITIGAGSAAAPRGAGGRRRLAILLPCASAAAVTICLAFAALPRPTLFVAAFPTTGAGSHLSGVLERRVETRPGYSLVSYAPDRGEAPSAGPADATQPAGALRLIGLAAPADRGIALDDLDALATRLRFAAPPRVTSRDGRLFVGADGLLLGWAVHDGQ